MGATIDLTARREQEAINRIVEQTIEAMPAAFDDADAQTARMNAEIAAAATYAAKIEAAQKWYKWVKGVA